MSSTTRCSGCKKPFPPGWDSRLDVCLACYKRACEAQLDMACGEGDWDALTWREMGLPGDPPGDDEERTD